MGHPKKGIFTSRFFSKAESTVCGKGVFAKRDFSEGCFIGSLKGKRRNTPTRTSVQFNASIHIEPDLNNFGRYLNHSCDANAYFCGRNLHAWRQIRKGEEITIDYNCTEYVVSSPFKCNCNASDCVGEIKGFHFLSDNQKKNRKGKLAKWYRSISD
jgi:hypothetical protein